jgi:hypothetical protein
LIVNGQKIVAPGEEIVSARLALVADETSESDLAD